MRGKDGVESEIPALNISDDTREKMFTQSEGPASQTSLITEKDQEIVPGKSGEMEQEMENKEQKEETLNQVQKKGNSDADVTETCVTKTNEEVQQHIGESEDGEEDPTEDEEEEPQLYRNDTVVAEDSGTDNSDDEEEEEEEKEMKEEVEEEFCDLVQRLHSALLSTPTGKCTG
ncbi:hypothetical protein Baya_4704 [Bagarius yarrelli]|uniref:Uncharacterized protein n=1 Tax=Bagarius yarrelli TaxID=175774 RepID=A0A556TTH3_BAGYA|nr:hypothetical protein Baya_4704 [Bagarius yarrelli]